MTPREKRTDLLVRIGKYLSTPTDDLKIKRDLTDACNLLDEAADILRSRELNQPVAWQWRKRDKLTNQWAAWHNGSGEQDLFRYQRAKSIANGKLETRELFA